MKHPKSNIGNPILLTKIRSGAAIALSMALQQIFPKCIVIGARATDIGFACDCLFSELIDDSILPLVERQMNAITRQDLELTVTEMLLTNVAEYLRYHGQPQRADLLEADAELAEVVRIGSFLEVIAGPHVDTLREVNAFKLQGIEVMDRLLVDQAPHRVTTIYGAAFGNKQELKQFLKIADVAAEKDHRLLGRELGLYDIYPEAGGGAYLWRGKGQIIRDILLDWWRAQQTAQGFQMIHTPVLVHGDLPESRLPLHAALFSQRLHSYRELPIRYAECAPLHQELALHECLGLYRQQTFAGDEQSIFCQPEQVVESLTSSLQFIQRSLKILGFSFRSYLYCRGAGYCGTLGQWDRAYGWVKEALSTSQTTVSEEVALRGLSGPRVEFKILDALGREWPGPMVGVDFALPEQCGLRYQGKQDEMLTPIMVVRKTLGSVERAVGLLVERYGGALPLWLAPEQVRLLPVNESQRPFAKQISLQCQEVGLRVGIDERNERLGAKVFAAEAAKIPFIAIIGEQEAREGIVTVRTGQSKKQGDRMTIDALIALAKTKTSQE